MTTRVAAIATPDMIAFATARRRAAARGVWTGDTTDFGALAYFNTCRDLHPSGVLVLFTRDTGHHSSGWWKNPEYERCEHLSLSFWDLGAGVSRSPERGEAETWVRLFFGPHSALVWEEGPASDAGRSRGVRHYRVFCDERWRPIKPRGEVYSTHLTEIGWKSWSQVQAERSA